MSACDCRIRGDSQSAFMILMPPCISVHILHTSRRFGSSTCAARRGARLLLMGGKLQAIGAKMERDACSEAPWPVQAHVPALAKVDRVSKRG